MSGAHRQPTVKKNLHNYVPQKSDDPNSKTQKLSLADSMAFLLILRAGLLWTLSQLSVGQVCIPGNKNAAYVSRITVRAAPPPSQSPQLVQFTHTPVLSCAGCDVL